MVETKVARRGEAPSGGGEKQNKGNKTVVKRKATLQHVQHQQQEAKKKEKEKKRKKEKKKKQNSKSKRSKRSK